MEASLPPQFTKEIDGRNIYAALCSGGKDASTPSLPSAYKKSSHEGCSFCAERQGFFLRFAAKALRDNEPVGSHPCRLLTKKAAMKAALFCAERQGFEPWVPVRAQRFSRPPRSTTPASLLGCCGCKVSQKFAILQIFFAFDVKKQPCNCRLHG